MPLISRIAAFFVLLIGLAGGAHATDGQTDIAVTDAVASRVVASHATIVPGQTFQLAWQIKLEPHWHIYWQNPGDSGLAPRLTPNDPTYTVGETRWPTPKLIPLPPITNYGYEDKVVLVMPVTAPTILPPGATTLPLRLEYLYCKDICLPGKVTLDLPLTVGSAPLENPLFGQLAAENRETLPQPMPATHEVRAYLREGNVHLVFNAQDIGAVAPRFFPHAEGWLDDGAAQTILHQPPYMDMTLPRDLHGNAEITEVQGLLVRADGKGFVINVPLGDAPLLPEDPNQLPWVLLAAFVAGLVLNLMPCVLPVIALKVFSLLRTTNHTERLSHMLVYAAGVLVTFWGMAGIIAAIQQGGHQLGWGFQMQNPLFVAAMAALMLAMALSFWGVFSAGSWLTRVTTPTRKAMHESWAEAFLTGMVAVVVATPCTVPFMGTAMAYALAQPFWGIVQVFTALGLGMAAPLALVALFPPLARWLPRPGPWMDTFKQLLGWPMLATALWLVWVFAGQTNTAALFVLLGGLGLLGFTLWLYGRLGGWSALAVAAVLAGGALVIPDYTAPGEQPASRWQPWSKAAEQAARATGPVFVDFTADWCITCKFTEATVLNTQSVQQLFVARNVTLLQGDWTSYDEAITAELARHNRRGVPLYLLYLPEKDEPLILPQLLTRAVLEEALTATRP
ncbi:MAG: thioredoxin family protein [Pseudomonadaceae bacterium]|nr:thioredoxin family protein [Pseudomonadaceae bacterium]